MLTNEVADMVWREARLKFREEYPDFEPLMGHVADLAEREFGECSEGKEGHPRFLVEAPDFAVLCMLRCCEMWAKAGRKP